MQNEKLKLVCRFSFEVDEQREREWEAKSHTSIKREISEKSLIHPQLCRYMRTQTKPKAPQNRQSLHDSDLKALFQCFGRFFHFPKPLKLKCLSNKFPFFLSFFNSSANSIWHLICWQYNMYIFNWILLEFISTSPPSSEHSQKSSQFRKVY